MSHREFTNAFEGYDGENLYDFETKKLNVEYSSKLTKAVKELIQTLECHTDSNSKDYSVYTGTSGYALLYFHLARKFEDQEPKSCLTKADKWLKHGLDSLKGSRYSFLCGDAGPLAISAAVAHAKGDKTSSQNYISRLEGMCDGVCSDSELPDELLYGRCGFLSALLFVQKHCGLDSISRDCIIKVVQVILRSGEKMSRRQRCSHPLMYEWHDKAYLGAAHGLAGIYNILLQVKEPTMQEEIHQRVRPCIDYLLTLRFPSGNGPSSIGSSGGDKLIHWCHGAPGWVHLFSLAYKLFGDHKYLEAAKDCGNVVWQRGLLRKGYGLCHGIAGNAYTFLTLFKLTGDQRYLYYAYKFAEWCCDYGKHGCQTPDRPFSLFEGMAGTIYFLSDLLDPTSSAFPAFQF